MIELDYKFHDSPTETPVEYNEEDFGTFFKFMLGRGLMPGEGEEGNCTANPAETMEVFVEPFLAFIDGRYIENDTQRTLTVGSSGGSDRIDRVVLKLNTTDKKAELYVKEGTSTPPALDANELSFFQIEVDAEVTDIFDADIIDERNDYTVCGYGQPYGWLIRQRVVTAPREDEIIRDGDGNITETNHYIPVKNGGNLRWKEEISRDGDGNITQIDRTAYADDGSTVVHTSKETITRDGDGNATGVVTE